MHTRTAPTTDRGVAARTGDERDVTATIGAVRTLVSGVAALSLIAAACGGEDERSVDDGLALGVIPVIGVERTFDGRCEGRIGSKPQGAGGFGYDPLFWPVDEPGRTMAELTMDAKNAISHRGHALALLREHLLGA